MLQGQVSLHHKKTTIAFLEPQTCLQNNIKAGPGFHGSTIPLEDSV